MNRDCRRR
ncbi:cytochrome c551 peroxidase, partial [Vibrio parahaemolyticus V-223/04]